MKGFDKILDITEEDCMTLRIGLAERRRNGTEESAVAGSGSKEPVAKFKGSED